MKLDARSQRSRGRSLGRRALFVAGGLVLLVLITEMLLRRFKPQVFIHHPPGMYMPHVDLGHVLTPSFEGELRKADFTMQFRTNQVGLRGDDLPPPSDTTVRVLCLGDGLTWGVGVGDSETYPSRLGYRLQERYPSSQVEVLNAGTVHYATLEELAWLRLRGAEFEPDIVIVQFNSYDDFKQNQQPSSLRHEFRDDLMWVRDDYAATARPALWRFIYWLKHESHLAHLLSERAGLVAMRAGWLADWENASSVHFTAEQGRETGDLLAEFRPLGDRLGARTLLLFVPEKMQVLAGVEPPLRAAEVVRMAAEESGAEFLDLTEALVAEDDSARLFLIDGGHWTAEGNDFVASRVRDKIEDLGWLDAQPE